MKKIIIISFVIMCFAIFCAGTAQPVHAASGCGFDSAGDYTCRSDGNLRTPSDPGMPNIPGYSGPGQDGRVIPPRPLYTPGDLVPGLIIPFIPEFPPFVFPILVPLPGVPIIPIVVCNPVTPSPVTPTPPIGPVTPGQNVCSYASGPALVLAREHPAMANMPDDAQMCTYRDGGPGCGDANRYNAIGPGIRLGCNPNTVRKPDGSFVRMEQGECTTKALVMEAYGQIIASRYQPQVNSAMSDAAAAGHPVCNTCLQNAMLSMAYRGDLLSIPGLRQSIVNGNYQQAINNVNNSNTNINDPALAQRKQDIIDALQNAASNPC